MIDIKMAIDYVKVCELDNIDDMHKDYSLHYAYFNRLTLVNSNMFSNHIRKNK